MTPFELTSFVTILANFISCQVTDSELLDLYAAIFTQLGDTIATIAVQKNRCNNSNSSLSCDNPNSSLME